MTLPPPAAAACPIRSRWHAADASAQADDLDLRVYSTRLLGCEADLVLHGGGNSSVKLTRTDVTGEEQEILFVKGSGWDMSTIRRQGFSPCRLRRLQALLTLDHLRDIDMAMELRASMTDPAAPAPSVEALLHAAIPLPWVDHTHADAVVTLTNSLAAAAALETVYGDEVLVIPYVMPGFLLARAARRLLQERLTDGVRGIILLNHGIFTFGHTAEQSYEGMIDLVARAQQHVAAHRTWRAAPSPPLDDPACVALAAVRRDVSVLAGTPMLLRRSRSTSIAALVAHPRRDDISQRGPATPDHVIRTKRIPLVGRDLEAYATAYRAYFSEHCDRRGTALTMLDPAPRVILDGELGALCAGRLAADVAIVDDIYTHTARIILDAEDLGGYRPVSAGDAFDVEYWDLEQAKLARAHQAGGFAGQVMVVSGAAGGIGRAVCEELLSTGAAVLGIDVDAAVLERFRHPAWLGWVADVRDSVAVGSALRAAVEHFGGIDAVVVNAGIFPPSQEIANLDADLWRRVMAINLDASVALMTASLPYLERSPAGGRVLIVGSKNVAAPGPGAAAYSASKAALTQVARVAALEWGGRGIRVNVLHPNAVFDTGIWTDDVLEARARSYGTTVERYRSMNVLGVEITSADVARLAAAVLGPAFSRTTGAQIPIDGGTDRTI